MDDYQLRFATLDGDGQIGSVERPIAARLHTIGDMLTSDMLLSTIDGHGAQKLRALETLPPDAAKLRTGIELYPGIGPLKPVHVHLVLKTRDEAGTVIAEDTLTPSGNATSMLVGATLPIDALPPGAYEIVATFLDGEKALGTLSTVFVK